MTTEKEKALELAIDQIEKQFGQGSIMRFNDSKALAQIAVIPSGSVALDIALGVGGIPRGRITEIFGPESSGKTTLAQHIIAEAQKMGGKAAYIDVEHALDPTYARTCGVNLDELLISQPDTGEEALEICETLVRSNAIDIIVVDSVAALVPRAEIEGDMGDAQGGSGTVDVQALANYGFHRPHGDSGGFYQPAQGKSRHHFWQSGGNSRWACPEVLQLGQN
jgi:recombination protein RecA